ncbi:MAG: hypothetical protein GY850_35090 [bacterium]|nr:hypothetical protein [bacterium]
MKVKEIPQDDIKTFKGFGTKALYAVDENGQYTRTQTSGWEVEEVVLRDVVDDFAKLAEQAKTRAFRGETSPIEYYMNKYYMDLPALARGMGLAKWRVKRHFNPTVFRKLNQKMLQSYAVFFNIDVHTLKNIKENF